MAKQKLSSVQRLQHHWRNRLPEGARNDFDALVGNEEIKLPGVMKFDDIKSKIAEAIAQGFPLSFEQFHIALAERYLLTELPYEEYFRKLWHQTTGHRGYGPRNTSHCHVCRSEAKERRQAKNRKATANVPK